MNFLKYFILFLSVVLSNINFAFANNFNSVNEKNLTSTKVLKKLSQTSAWHALLHYKKSSLFGGWKSQADDADFFLSQEGKTNPEKELLATLNSFSDPAIDVDKHSQCRFPARYYWLKKQLGTKNSQIKPVVCHELNRWFEKLKPGSITLVFPASYINSPSSMFGHTLLRVNPNDYRKNAPLVSYALNYAADANATDNSLIFSIKGLIGGYPGRFSIVPYHEKIRDYSDLENRDIWEYELNFTEEETQQLMRHAWELRKIQFDYYFLTENCSYHMLSLMDVAREGLRLTSSFETKAIPADTVRAVQAAGLIKKHYYRPASTTILKQHAKQLSQKNNKLSIAIAKSNISLEDAQLDKKTITEQARVNEQAYDYSRFLSSANPTARDANARTNWQLLSNRSQLKVDKVWDAIKEPKVRIENGHKTTRIAIGAGVQAHHNFISLQLRPAYHDVLDLPLGFTQGAQINFLDLNVRYFNQEQKFRLKKVTFINVLSLSAVSDYFSPISWGVDFSIERVQVKNTQLNALQLDINSGYSTNFFGKNLASALLVFNLKTAKLYDKGYTAGAGLKLNLLRQTNFHSLQFSLLLLSFKAGEENINKSVALTYAYHLSTNQQIRVDFKREENYKIRTSDMQLAYHYYY